MNKNQKIFLYISIICILFLIVLKIFISNNNKQKVEKYYNSFNMSNIEFVVYDNSHIQDFIKVWKFLYTLKDNKTVAYEFKRKIEKQDPIFILTNKENFINLVKSLNFSQLQKDTIKELFTNEEEFYNLFYVFYSYLVISQLDEQKVTELKKQANFIKSKIYKVDPKLVDKIKSKNDPELNQLFKEIEKNIYQNDLSQEKLNLLIEQLKKINAIIDIYNQLSDKEDFKWMIQKRKFIINSLKL